MLRFLMNDKYLDLLNGENMLSLQMSAYIL